MDEDTATWVVPAPSSPADALELVTAAGQVWATAQL
jgi:hypothetical protein